MAYIYIYILGVGMASVVVSFLMSTYYSVIIAYAIYYFFAAFRPEIPWLDCSHRFVNFIQKYTVKSSQMA